MHVNDIDFTRLDECDILIAGSGIAGMCAAYEAALAGRRVVVVDAYPELGGASLISGASSSIVGTPLQEAAGIKDSVELAFEDWVRTGGPSVDREWALRFLTDTRREVYDWVIQQFGITWLGPKRSENNSVPRGHKPRGGGGAVTTAVTEAARALGVACVTSTRLERLLTTDGVVTGAVLSHNGAERPVRARAVVMATGGFANNPAMLLAQAPVLRGVRRFLCGGAAQADGSGHAVLEAFGADFTYLENVWVYPDGTPNPRDPSGQRGVLMRGTKTEIWLNERAERFHNERLTDGGSGGPAILAQPGQHCWSIVDRRAPATVDLRDDPYYGTSSTPNRSRVEEFFATSTHVWKADTLAALAERIELPPEKVVAEVEAFNASVTSGNGVEQRYERDVRDACPIVEPPFYAVEYMPTVQKTLGGVHTDLDCRVLDRSGQPITGLYAAGELAGMAGGHINGAVATQNTMFAPSLYSGRVAGKAVARYVAGRDYAGPFPS